jgi:hypothetical protein
LKCIEVQDMKKSKAARPKATPPNVNGHAVDGLAPWDPSVPIPQPTESPRGLLPTTDFIAALVDREEKRLLLTKNLRITPEAKQRITDTYNLQFYFGGQEIAYRETPVGIEVLAAGLQEIRKLLKRVKPAELTGIVFGQAPTW